MTEDIQSCAMPRMLVLSASEIAEAYRDFLDAFLLPTDDQRALRIQRSLMAMEGAIARARAAMGLPIPAPPPPPAPPGTSMA